MALTLTLALTLTAPLPLIPQSTRLAEAAGALALDEAPLQLSATPSSDLRGLLHDAARSARMCVSEGRSGVAEARRSEAAALACAPLAAATP